MNKSDLLGGLSPQAGTPTCDMPHAGMKMQISSRNNMLTIEFERNVSWLQFSRDEAIRFVQELAKHINAI